AGSVFPGGQTGCALPGNPNQPSSVALDPQGNLWVGSKSASILRFNNPDAASIDFGSCAAFIQAVATTPNNRVVTGLAWIGHNLWGADSESAFVIPDADIACLISPNPPCSPANGTVLAVPSIAGPTSLGGDQFYPNTNGDNLYFGLTNNIAWLGNAGAATASQTLAPAYVGPSVALANVGAIVVDGTDPANLMVFSGDDPSGLGTAGAGRWFQTTGTSAGLAAPGTPLNVVAEGNDSQVTLTWSPAQVAQPVTSYTVHNNFASNGVTVGDITVNPAGSSPYPPTTTTISGLTNFVSYQFQVLAGNNQGSSAFGTSNMVTPPGLSAPGVPGGVQAIAGDAQAYVKWSPPVNASVVPITGYTVTALQGGAFTGITASVRGTATTAIVSGLTNGKSYTFTVHATNGVGSSGESAQSASITPLATILPVMKIEVNGPGSVTSVPALVTYQVVVTNTSLFPVTNILVNDVLSTTDFAYIVSAQPEQGFCTSGGSGVTNVVCSLGRMAGQQIVTINVTAQMQGAQIADTARVTGTDENLDSLTFKIEHRATSPPSSGSPITSSLPSISVPVSASATPTSLHAGDSGTITWTIADTTSVAAEDVVFFISVDIGLTVDSVTVSPSSGPTPASCSSLLPGLIGSNSIVCTIAALGGANPVQKMTVQLGVTAPNRTGLTFLPSGTVSFLGNDSSQATATVKLKVN
ncbi:MAG TPA: fibronectin type III domain-containing protein, partial [Candidatus Limnocylindrales bacterium]|nr:fibronectin type III domain-containing protein [Candidatus Limnocylindrales bacterium]